MCVEGAEVDCGGRGGLEEGLDCALEVGWEVRGCDEVEGCAEAEEVRDAFWGFDGRSGWCGV